MVVRPRFDSYLCEDAPSPCHGGTLYGGILLEIPKSFPRAVEGPSGSNKAPTWLCARVSKDLDMRLGHRSETQNSYMDKKFGIGVPVSTEYGSQRYTTEAHQLAPGA